MSSKAVHTIAGATIVGVTFFAFKPEIPSLCAVLLGSMAGSSAPDWLEMPSKKMIYHWFKKNESVRESIIPHRTITHTLSLWLFLFLLLAIYPTLAIVKLCGLTFIFSAMVHLFLDFRTPMGIPLLPFGKRYRLNGLRIERSRVVQKRSGWI